MLKGEPGTRKSTQALSFPLPQYWISTDQKMEALGLPAREWGIDTSQVNYDDYNSWMDIDKKLTALSVKCPFKTVILDSVTTAGDCINDQTLSQSSTKGGGAKGVSIGGIRVETFDDYKAEARAFRIALKKLNDIRKFHKINVILIAHVIGERKVDEVSTTAQSRIIITGGKAISGKISAYAIEAYHFDTRPNTNPDKEGIYGAITVSSGIDFARSSLNLPGRITFNNQPLYQTHILPAINKLDNKEQ
jgi:hypothetical protein